VAVNDEIRDQLLAHQVELIRFGKGLATRINRLINKGEPELQRALRARLDRIAHLGWDPGPATTRRMQRTLKLITEINKPTFAEINALVRKELRGLAIGETAFMSGVLTDSLPVVFEPVLPTAATLAGIVRARPFNDEVLRQWLGTYSRGDRRRMMDEIRQGLLFDETPTQISRRIFGTRALGGTDGVREITRRGAQTLAQTSTSAVSNASHNSPGAICRDPGFAHHANLSKPGRPGISGRRGTHTARPHQLPINPGADSQRAQAGDPSCGGRYRAKPAWA